MASSADRTLFNHTSTNEQHRPKFRGTWNPAELHYLLHDRKIAPTEFVLLTVIDSLVDAKGEGCWASNKYLAERLSRSVPHVQTMLRKLKRIGLVKQVGWKQVGEQQFRVLETAWSRVDTEGEGGIISNTPTRITDNTQSTNYVSIKEESSPPPHSSNGRTTRLKRNPPPFCTEWSKVLRRILRDNQAPITKWTQEGGATAFHKLYKSLNKDSDRIDRLLADYRKHFDKITSPTIISVHQFCKPTLFTWLEDVVRKLKNPQRYTTDEGGYRRKIAKGDEDLYMTEEEQW